MIYLLSFAVIIFTITFRLIFASNRKKINIKDKLALITGGANGLGQNICIELAKEGCNIAFCDISSPEDTLHKLKSFNVKVKAYKTDVSKSEEIVQLRDDVERDFGCGVDILVNNAGLIPYKTVLEQSYEEIQKLTEVNVTAIFMVSKCFLERMIISDEGGHIVSISSLQGIYPFPHSVLYSSTKFAVTGFMLGLKEFLRLQKLNKIHTTTILPHVIGTRKDLVDALNPNVVPIMQPKDIAKTITEAILYRKSFVPIPSFYGILIPIFNCLPFPLQSFIRDIQQENLFLSQKIH